MDLKTKYIFLKMPKTSGYKLIKSEKTVYLKNDVEIVGVQKKYIDVLGVDMADFYKVKDDEKASGDGPRVDSYKVFNQDPITASEALSPTAGVNQKELEQVSLKDGKMEAQPSLDGPADNSGQKQASSEVSPGKGATEKDAILSDYPSTSSGSRALFSDTLPAPTDPLSSFSFSILSGPSKPESVGSQKGVIFKPSSPVSSGVSTPLSKRDCMVVDKTGTSEIRTQEEPPSGQILKTSSIRLDEDDSVEDEEAPPIKSWKGVFGRLLLAGFGSDERKILGVTKNMQPAEVKLLPTSPHSDLGVGAASEGTESRELELLEKSDSDDESFEECSGEGVLEPSQDDSDNETFYDVPDHPDDDELMRQVDGLRDRITNLYYRKLAVIYSERRPDGTLTEEARGEAVEAVNNLIVLSALQRNSLNGAGP